MTRLLQGLPFRFRLALALIGAVLPFATVLLFANLWVYRPMQDDVQLTSSQIQDRFEEVSRLQLLLSRSAMPPNDYLLHGAKDERIRFELLAGQIETLFKGLLNDQGFGRPEQEKRLTDMLRRWAVARQMGLALLSWPDETRHSDAAAAMERFDREVDLLTEEAESLLAHVRVELDEARNKALRRRHDLNRFVALAVAMAGILTLILVTLLARTGVSSGRLRKPPMPELPAAPPRPATESVLGESVLEFAFEPAPPAADETFEFAGDDGAREDGAGSDVAGKQEPAVDPLTRLWSRGSLQRQLVIETERAMVLETPSSVALIEIDGFGEMEERYGDALLDSLVLSLSERVRHVIRSTDFPSRSNKGEFAVLMPATDINQAVEIAERLRHQVADTPVSIGRRTASVTISVGVAGDSSRRAGQVGASTLLGRADQALHRARRAGGNRVERSGAT